MSKIHPEIWRNGNTVAEGFTWPEHELIYLSNKETAGEYGIIILSIEGMAQIIANYQKRLREYRRNNAQ